MADPIVIDMTKATRRKKRSQRDLKRFWQLRYDRFTRAGYSPKEATWAADSGLSIRHADVRRILRRRKEHVEYYMYRWNYSRTAAITECAKDLRNKLDAEGIDELNLFYEVSP